MVEGPYKLPKGWRWVRLGEVSSRDSTTLKPTDFPNRVFNYIGMEHVEPGQWDEPQPVQVMGRDIKSQVIVFRPGHVLYGKLRPYLNKVVVPTTEGIASTEFIPILPESTILDPKYLGAFLRSPSFVAYASRNTTGSRQPRVKSEALWSALIPLPPLQEQRRIVAKLEELLGRIREAKRLHEEVKRDLDRFWQSVLAETFPRPGSELPEGWRWVRLGEVCESKSGIWGPEASDSSEGFPIVRSTEIIEMVIRPENASIRRVSIDRARLYELQAGDILVNKSSGSSHLVGWSAIFEGSPDGRTYLFSNFMLRLRVDKDIMEPWFLLYYLHNPHAREVYLSAQNTTSGLRNLRIRDFLDQFVPLPPLQEQKRIVAYLEAVQTRVKTLKEKLRETEEKLKQLEQAVLERAFRGEL